jgi:hypothetical protein
VRVLRTLRVPYPWNGEQPSSAQLVLKNGLAALTDRQGKLTAYAAELAD